MNVFTSEVSLLTIWCLLIVTVTSTEISSSSNDSSDAVKNYHPQLYARFKADHERKLERSLFLRVSARHNEPFMYQNEMGAFYNGIEYKLIKMITEKLNLNLLIGSQTRSSPDNIERLFSNETDILVGGLFPNITPSSGITISPPYFQDDLTWCIQRSKEIPWLIGVFLAADPECWLLMIFGVGYVSAIIIYIMIQFDLEYEHRNKRDFHYITAFVALPALVGSNQRFEPKNIPLRLFYGYVLLVMSFAWQTFFFLGWHYFKYPGRFPQTSTVTKIAGSGYRLAGSMEALSLISFDTRYKQSQIDSFFVCQSIDSCLDHLKHDDNTDLAVGGSRQHISNSPSYSPSKLFCFDYDEHIASYQPTLLMRPDFDLGPEIDSIIRKAFESGLFVKWDRESQRKKERVVPYQPPPELTLEQYSFGLVTIYCTGMICSVFGFLLEIIVRRQTRKKPHPPWTYLEHLVNGHRNYFKDLPEKLQKENLAQCHKKKTVKMGNGNIPKVPNHL